MDDPKKPPIVFANRVLRQFVDHMLDEEIMVLPQDYMVMRTAFRRHHGSWEALTQGDIRHSRLLARIVKAWGGMPHRLKKTETV